MRNDTAESIARRYRILDTLGQGGMGTVHVARDRLAGLVALKRLTTSTEPWDRALEALDHQGTAPPGAITAGGDEPVGLRATRLSETAPPMAASLEATALSPGEASSVAMESTVWHVSGLARATRNLGTAGTGASPHHDQVEEMLRLTLAREFRLLSSLRHPNIISVLDYGFDDRLQPYFTMELLEHAESIMKAAATLPVGGKVDLIAQTLQALAYLHRRGVIHRDLKPGNVMVVDGRVKVLDFGVSILREHDTESGKLIVGTLAYMAPELLGGAPASEASDLYAVGIIAYELLAGRHPFDIQDVAALRDAILHRAPDLSPIDARLAPVVGALLEKRPVDRPATVDAVLAALSACTGQTLTVETAATRESFLQAAELVGRDAELHELAGMLGGALAGTGSAALVGGESGVGKSRLLDELRARALVDGVVVLRGQAEREGGPYHVFRDVLRGMVLRTDVDDLEAGVLEAVVHDLAALLERPVPARAELDPEAAQGRLVAVIEAMFRRQQAPMLVVLEDLQWAGSESLRLVAQLARIAGELPLLLVGTYRDDERAGLPAELPAMRVLKLRRLTAEGIAALAASMLGDAGRRPEVIERLQRETEGNPFFLVEVVRALAEDAGALHRVGSEPMPATVAAGGMHLIVRRRLDQVPREDRALLEAAAVVGRQIDPALLRRLDPGVDLEAWFEACADVAVLEVDETSYRFAHDKLREGLLAALSPDACRALHRRIAEAIEAEYPDDPGHTAALAHHWTVAGDTVKEARYSALAGEQALQSSAYREAAAYFERAIALVSAGAASRGDADASLVARALRALAPIVPLGAKAVSAGGDRFRLGSWEGRLSETYGRLSNHGESFRRGGRALSYLGRPMPEGQASLLLGLPVQMALRGLQSLAPARFGGASADERAVLLEAARIQNHVTEACFYTQEQLPMLWSGLATLNLGEPAGPSATLACGYALMAAVAGVVPLHSMAEAWSRRAVDLVESVGKPYDVAFVLQRVSSYRLWMGEWEVAEAGFQRETEIARRVGDQRMRGDAMMCLVFAGTYRARFARVVEQFHELDVWMRRTADAQLLCGGRVADANARLRLGRTAEALALCREAQPLADASSASHDVIRCHGVLALCALRAGDERLARAAAERALAVIQATRPVAYWTLDGIAAVAEAALTLWEQSLSGPPEERAALARLAEQACRGADAYAAVFPIGKPFALLWSGLRAQLAGHPEKARKTWERCLGEADRLGMPYEQARAHLELGRHLPVGDPARRAHLLKAAAIFTEVGAAPDRARCDDAPV
jgi:serine/threonine protein kinase/tetratricopeptide (TPR) repeat protein